MSQHAATREDLRRFFNLKKTRSVPPVLKELGVSCPGKVIPWSLIWKAIGLAPDQQPHHHAELTAPLMTAAEVAAELGVDPETIYRWVREARPDMPAVILLGPRGMRWRKSEIRAWQAQEPMPLYAHMTKRNEPTFQVPDEVEELAQRGDDHGA